MFDQSTTNDQVITELVSHMNSREHLLKLLHGWNKTVLLTVDDKPFALHCTEDGVRLALAEAPADIGFTMDRPTLLQIAREEITPLAAKVSGRIASTGSLIQILRFAGILSTTVHDYNRGG
jgi:putative sterol carrier protein